MPVGGRFAPIYTEGVKGLKKERILYAVLDELCHCSNPRGLSYCGVRYIANERGYAPESVTNALLKLCDDDYIRCHLSSDDVGSGKRVVWQVNPHSVLYIRETMYGEVSELWEQGKHYNVILDEMKYTQPYMDPEAKPEAKPDDNPKDKPQKTASNREGRNRSSQAHDNGESNTGVSRSKNNGKAVTQATASMQSDTIANGETHGKAENKDLTPPRSAAPPPFDQPLEDFDAEQCAQSLRIFGGGTKITVARELVWKYGIGRVEKAKEMANKPTVKSPMGYLRKALETGIVTINPFEGHWLSYQLDEYGEFYHDASSEMLKERDELIRKAYGHGK